MAASARALYNPELDHWERIWLDTKVDIVDTFHLIVTTMVQDLSGASATELAAGADRTFGIIFALLDITPQSTSVEAMPFLNRSLVADYQHAYDLSRTLGSVLQRVSRDDARMQLLESTLRSLDVEPGTSGGHAKDPGVLRLILRSSGIAPGASSKAPLSAHSVPTDKGKAKAAASELTVSHDADLDLQVTQVLDIFPDHSSEYIRKLLTHPSFPFRGNAERVIEALLEETAPDEDALGKSMVDSEALTAVAPATLDAPIERRNVFDEEIMDLHRIHVGKKKQDKVSLARDRAEVERMKAEILQLTEAMSVDSDEESGRPRALDVIDLDDDLDEPGASTVRVLGDGEDSGDEEGDERGVDPIKPETVLERAYLRDPKLFDRDAQTRRSKQRSDLKQQTGWTDEQIEGWRIMLERNPKKERILQKHEFSGNRAVPIPIAERSGDQPSGEQRGGRGRGRGRGPRSRSRGKRKKWTRRKERGCSTRESIQGKAWI
ncbi:hypothetical protein JVU11DRAFT_5745 [Chiua virens]|nr:hypothetical protein JVU11DRAFT_5745 [Chiua virens]